MYPKIPEYEIAWLRGLDSQYKVYKSHSMETVYPVSILPPKLKKFVKDENRDIDYINLGPHGHSDSDCNEWNIWGWKELPEKSKSNRGADWSHLITAEKERPTAEDVQAKIQRIQDELTELKKLVARM